MQNTIVNINNHSQEINRLNVEKCGTYAESLPAKDYTFIYMSEPPYDEWQVYEITEEYQYENIEELVKNGVIAFHTYIDDTPLFMRLPVIGENV